MWKSWPVKQKVKVVVFTFILFLLSLTLPLPVLVREYVCIFRQFELRKVYFWGIPNPARVAAEKLGKLAR